MYSQKQQEREQRIYRESLLKKARFEDLLQSQEEDQIEEPPQPKRREYHNIQNVLYVDQKIMNFNSFMPSKLIGINLLVVNRTNCEQIIELSVDEMSYMYHK